MIGATGTGTSSLINVMINYLHDVSFDEKNWLEIIEAKANQTDSQTKTVTVYDIYIEDRPLFLTVIDTPGFGSTDGFEKDFRTAANLHELFTSKDGVQEIDLVCLVVSAVNARLTQIQLYILKEIFSLFGKDVENNIVVLITRAATKPINAIKAIKESGVKCAQTDGEPVYFRFNNSHCEALLEEYDSEEQYISEHKAAWDVFEENMGKLFDFLKTVQPVSMKLTATVTTISKQLMECVIHLKGLIVTMEQDKSELEKVTEALRQHEKEKKDMKDFKYEVDEVYKEKVPIESKWWHWTKEATCCSVCEENCHYPGCWWVRDLSWCSVMKDGKCTMCTGRCDYTQHVKERKIYMTKTKKVKRTYEELRKKYKKESGIKMSLISRLEKEIKMQEINKTRLVEECYQLVITLHNVALNTDSLSTLQHLDFLIEKLKEAGKTESVQKLEELKTQSEDQNSSWLAPIM